MQQKANFSEEALIKAKESDDEAGQRMQLFYILQGLLHLHLCQAPCELVPETRVSLTLGRRGWWEGVAISSYTTRRCVKMYYSTNTRHFQARTRTCMDVFNVQRPRPGLSWSECCLSALIWSKTAKQRTNSVDTSPSRDQHLTLTVQCFAPTSFVWTSPFPRSIFAELTSPELNHGVYLPSAATLGRLNERRL